MASGSIHLLENEGILEISIDRPQSKNALTAEMYTDLADALTMASSNAAIRVVLLAGAGGNFSTGNDLQDFLQNPPSGEQDPVFRFLRSMAACTKPIVCAVEGFAVGVGMTLLLHADLVYASPSTKFQLPFVNLGVVPEAGSSYLLPLLIGHLRASELCLLGDMLDGTKALQYGIINELIASEDLMAHARKKAAQIAAKPAVPIQHTKALLKQAHQKPLLEQMKAEERLFVTLLKSPQTVEFLKNFFARKK